MEKGIHLQRTEDLKLDLRVMKQQKSIKGELETMFFELERENYCMGEANAENKKNIKDLEDKMGRLEPESEVTST